MDLLDVYQLEASHALQTGRSLASVKNRRQEALALCTACGDNCVYQYEMLREQLAMGF